MAGSAPKKKATKAAAKKASSTGGGVKKTPQATEDGRVDALRERLYSRQADARTNMPRTKLTSSRASDTPDDWVHEQPKPKPSAPTPAKPVAPVPPASTEHAPHTTSSDPHTARTMPRTQRSRTYRKKLIIGGVGFFAFALLLSSLFLFFGNNNISGRNISVEIHTDDFAVAGGEEVRMQIAVANNNAVPIEAATLIIRYPVGTQAADGSGKEIYSEQRQLEVIEPGEVRNLEISALIYGEENQEKVVNVAMEYRVRGSNAVFYKDAEPLRLKISSSPAALLIDAVRTITSGQETEIELTIGSNSPTPLTNLLVQATYPNGFDFVRAEPAPLSGANVWRIDELEPEETVTITLTGVVTGGQGDTRIFDFSVGVPNERDEYSLASVYTTGSAEMDIEAPFLGVDVSVNGQRNDVVTVGSGESASVRVTFENTIEETIYDGGISVVLSGSALSDIDVDVDDGFYNSNTQTITWDGASNPSLEEILPGRSSSVSFSVTPDADISSTPEIQLSVTARGTRTYDDRVPETLESTASRTIRVESLAAATSLTTHAGGTLPPEVGEETEYRLVLRIANGSNDLSDATITATLPQYVTWEDIVIGDGSASFNSTNRTVTWDAGDVDGGDTAEVTLGVSFTPSASQVGRVPTLMETQRLRAEDRFTGTIVRATAPALTSAISGQDDDTGRVQGEN